jgi:hypothetical protein
MADLDPISAECRGPGAGHELCNGYVGGYDTYLCFCDRGGHAAWHVKEPTQASVQDGGAAHVITVKGRDRG